MRTVRPAGSRTGVPEERKSFLLSISLRVPLARVLPSKPASLAPPIVTEAWNRLYFFGGNGA